MSYMIIWPAGSKIAITDGQKSVTFDELLQSVSHLKIELQKLESTTLALEVESCVDHVLVVLAALDSDRSIALLEAGLGSEDLNDRLQLLPPCTLIKIVNSQIEIKDITNGTGVLRKESKLLLFTSGSKGRQKVVELSEKNIVANTAAVIESLDLASIEEQFLFLPLHYSFGLLGQLLPSFSLGLTTHIYRDFKEFFRSILTVPLRGMISGTPSHFSALLKVKDRLQCENVSHLVAAGAAMSPYLRRELASYFSQATIFTNYGQTEASPRILCLSSKDAKFFSQATGYSVGDWELKLNQSQELLVRGTQLMLGYADVSIEFLDDQGWMNTGDCAEIDQDGCVTLLGRQDDQIKIGGEKLFVLDVENRLKEILNSEDLVVVNIKSDLYGEQLVAVTEQVITLDTASLRKILASHKVDRLDLEDELPRLANGKVDRKKLQIKLLGQTR